jgi:hypothetical protein
MVFVIAALIIILLGALLLLMLVLGAVSLVREKYSRTSKPIEKTELHSVNGFENPMPEKLNRSAGRER